ncbi:MAG: Stage III sporulation protein AE [Brockia lithotrophica]|uniref:Stage III sporulation protein AE n=1 Tax=Brockia lithotrophica TaxID=933949 RepID=A0A2T5G671_9BACL|nr:MAG: Stage III sporulation protein AE [Brockia lithotrophica]
MRLPVPPPLRLWLAGAFFVVAASFHAIFGEPDPAHAEVLSSAGGRTGSSLGLPPAHAELPASASPSHVPPSRAGEISPAGREETLLREIDLSEMERWWEELRRDYGPFLPREYDSPLSSLLREPGVLLNPGALLRAFVSYTFHEIGEVSGRLGMVLFLALFLTLLEHLETAFSFSAGGRAATTVGFFLLALFAFQGFSLAYRVALDGASRMVELMAATLPLFFTLYAVGGQASTAAFLHPALFSFLELASLLIYRAVFPLLFASAVLEIVSSLAPSFSLHRLGRLFRQGGLVVLGVILTLFLGLTAVYGGILAAGDGLFLRTSKFAASTFLPFFGKMFSDAVETVFGTSLLLRNALGTVGVAALAWATFFPAVKVFVLAFLYQFAAALVEPLGTREVPVLLGRISEALYALFTALVLVAILFFLFVAVLVFLAYPFATLGL